LSVHFSVCLQCWWIVITYWNKKWKSARNMIGRCPGYHHVKTNPDPVISKTSLVWINVEFFTFGDCNLCIQWLACRALSASAELLVLFINWSTYYCMHSVWCNTIYLSSLFRMVRLPYTNIHLSILEWRWNRRDLQAIEVWPWRVYDPILRHLTTLLSR